MLGNRQPVDLYKLFMVVKEKGGYDVVCKNGLWDLVGEEYGLGVKVGSYVEGVYSKQLRTLETRLKNVAGSKFTECGLVDDRVKFGKRLMELQSEFLLDDYGEEEAGDKLKSVYDYQDGRKLCGTNRVKGMNPESNVDELERVYVYDYLDGRKLCGTNRVKGMNPEFHEAKKVKSEGLVDLNMVDHKTNEPGLGHLCNHNAAMDILEEFDGGKILAVDESDAVNNVHGLSDEGKRCDDDDDNDDDILILDPSSVNKERFGCKRKIVSMWNVSDAVNIMPGLSDGGKRCDDDDDDDDYDGDKDDNDNDILILDPSSIDTESFGKRESMQDMLSWVKGIAKNPCDPVVGSIPEKPKWKFYSSQEIWKQILLFREAVFLKKSFESINEHLTWKGQKMHPSLYDDQQGLTYNLRKRLKREERLLGGKSSSNGVCSGTQRGLERTQSPKSEVCAEKKLLESCTAGSSSLDRSARVPIPLGPAHQAEVPEWSGLTYESDSKWLGTQIWPQENVNSKLFFERDPIGKGREDSCGCQVQGSVECVRFHIDNKRTKLKLELGVAFSQWNLHKAGEQVRGLWTQEEEKKFKDVVKSNPPSHEICFWDHIFRAFPKKSREDLVSYYFNVFILQRRGYQNRHTPNDIDSDDDGSEYGPLKKVFGHKSRSFTLLPHKKPQRRR